MVFIALRSSSFLFNLYFPSRFCITMALQQTYRRGGRDAIDSKSTKVTVSVSCA